MTAKQILDEIHFSLEHLRKSKADAEDNLANARANKHQTETRIRDGEQDLEEARRLLADHELSVKAKKAERIKARAEKRVTAPFFLDDVQRRLVENVEEAEATVALLTEYDSKAASEVKTAEGDVAVATENIYRAHIEGIAARMLEHDALIHELHLELSALVPNELHRPRNQAPPSTVVLNAMALVKIDWMNTPVNKLGGSITPFKFNPPDRQGRSKFENPISTESVTVAGEDDFSLIPEPKPRFGVKI
jgi:predicted  nucleic acid-binding Zn-ribbon protein